ncbi:MAG: MmgE/PrpD family protein [Dehalococcoidia bacterium]|nr:MmgE/PrpD family protein [Dehalococcoidia bacterium]
MTYTRQIAEFMAQTRFEDLPPPVVHLAKVTILDAIGCAFGGFSHDRSVISRQVMESFGGLPEATVIGSDLKLSCIGAAYINAHMANALCADDIFCTLGHIAVAAFSPAFAMCERHKSTGKDLITAVAVGYEVASRIGLAVGKLTRIVNDKVEPLPVLGVGSWMSMASVASVGSLLRLNPEQAINALGLQAHHAPMPTGRHTTLAPVMAMNRFCDTGWMALGGIVSALMSKKGYTSFPAPGILDGEYGFWRMIGAPSCDFDLMVDKLGEKWLFLEESFKRWPADTYIQHPLTALDILLEKHKFHPEEIERVTITGGLMYPNFFNQDPKTEADAEFSVPHCAAMLILGIAPGPEWHTPEILNNPKVASLRHKVVLKADPAAVKIISDQIAKFPGVIREAPTTVKIDARGHTFSEFVKYHFGNNPWSEEFKMSDEDIKKKFRFNAASLLSASTVWRGSIERIIDACMGLERIANVEELGQLCRPGGREY